MRRGESGYAYLMALFILLAVIIASQVVLQNVVTQGRRDREAQTIWCGNQWARAVRLYYHKTGRYPQSVDDLKNGLPDLHFLRQEAYKNPMDPDEGAWRFIYVNGTGQIIGSVRYATLQQMALIDLAGNSLNGLQPGQLPGIPVSSMSSLGSSSGPNGGIFGTGNGTSSDNSNPSNNSSNANGTNAQGGPGVDNSSQNSSSGTSGSSNSNNSNGSQSSSSSQSAFGSSSQSAFGSSSQPGVPAGTVQNPLLALQPTGPVESPVIGAFLTGVGLPTKLDRNSIKVYHTAKKYKDWEFIWNPIEDQAQALQQGLNPQGTQPQVGQPAAGGLGTSGIGTGGMGGGILGNSSSFGGAITSPGTNSTSPSPSNQQ